MNHIIYCLSKSVHENRPKINLYLEFDLDHLLFRQDSLLSRSEKSKKYDVNQIPVLTYKIKRLFRENELDREEVMIFNNS